MAMAADDRGRPWFDVRGNYRGNCRGLPWVAMVGTTEFATERTAARAVEAPWAVALAVETRGFPRGNTRGSPR